jgi:hypothetical protein
MFGFFHSFFLKNFCCYFYLCYFVSPSTGCKSQFFNASWSGNTDSDKVPSIFCAILCITFAAAAVPSISQDTSSQQRKQKRPLCETVRSIFCSALNLDAAASFHSGMKFFGGGGGGELFLQGSAVYSQEINNNYLFDKKKVKLFFTVFFRVLKTAVLSRVRAAGWEHE